MSGDVTYVQGQMIANEFVNNLKSLSVSKSSNTYADAIETLHKQLKLAVPNGFKDNKQFAYTIVDNLYRIVPIIDSMLSTDDNNNNDFIQAKKFLTTLTNAFNVVCLFDVFTMLKDFSNLPIIFRHYIGLIKESYFTNNDKYEDLINCLIPIIAFSSLLIPITEDNIPSNLLTYLLTYTKQYWYSKSHERIIQSILGLIKIFSKKPTLVPMIIRAEWPNACIQWLITKDVSRPSYLIDYIINLILQKLARHTVGVPVLNQLNCLQALDESKKQMEIDHNETEVNCLNFIHCMIYALLTGEDEIKQMSSLNNNRMCQALQKLVLFTIKASQNELFTYECFHISEILSVLSKLFVNDDILLRCLSQSNELFDCLCQLIIHFTNLICDITKTHLPMDDETLLTLTNLLWSISFHQIYHEKFQNNSMLMHTLSNLATSSSLYTSTSSKMIPRDLCSLKKAAEGILWNLKSSSSKHLLTKSISEKTEQQPLAMISYSHSDSTFCRELVERLSAHVPVWVDYKQANDTIAHSDDLWEEIARAMEMATVIVLIVSKEYYDSKSCRQELSYASDTLKKRIVPIYAPNQQYRASGWLGIRIAGQKYIHFGRKLFTDAIKELASMIATDQKPMIISTPSPSSPVPQPLSEKIPCSLSEKIPCSLSDKIPCSLSEKTPCSLSEKIPEEENKSFTLNDWTAKDIQNWFNDNHICDDLKTLYVDQFHTGTALIVYARHLKLFYRNEYIRIFTKYHKQFNGKMLDTLDFITFVDALYRLRQEYDPNSDSEDSSTKYEQPLSCKTKNVEEGMTWL